MKPPNEEHTVSESTNHVYPKAAAGEQSANVAPNPSFPKLEESVLDYWDKDDTFQKSIERRPSGDHSQNEFVFFDGPPFANGLPHYGHLLTGYAKDVIPRYQTMKGHRVNRVFGWDTHGLPAELEAQKELGIDSVDQVKEWASTSSMMPAVPPCSSTPTSGRTTCTVRHVGSISSMATRR